MKRFSFYNSKRIDLIVILFSLNTPPYIKFGFVLIRLAVIKCAFIKINYIYWLILFLRRKYKPLTLVFFGCGLLLIMIKIFVNSVTT